MNPLRFSFFLLAIVAFSMFLSCGVRKSPVGDSPRRQNNFLEDFSVRYNSLFNAREIIEEEWNRRLFDTSNLGFPKISIPLVGFEASNHYPNDYVRLDSAIRKIHRSLLKKPQGSYLNDAFFLLGMAHYLKGDAYIAVSYFDRISFAEEADLSLIARAYTYRSLAKAEFYGGEESSVHDIDSTLSILERPFRFSRELQTEVFKAKAQQCLRDGQYAEAVTYVEKALDKERNRTLKYRLQLVLAQLSARGGQFHEAVEYVRALLESPISPTLRGVAFAEMLEWIGEDTTVVPSDAVADLLEDRAMKEFRIPLLKALALHHLEEGDVSHALAVVPSLMELTGGAYVDDVRKLQEGFELYFAQRQAYHLAGFYQSIREQVSGGLFSTDGSAVLSYAELDARVVRDQFLSKIVDDGDSKEERAKELLGQFEDMVRRRMFEVEPHAEVWSRWPLVEGEAEKSTAFQQSLKPASSQASSFYFLDSLGVARDRIDFRRRFGQIALADNWRYSSREGYSELALGHVADDDIWANRSKGLVIGGGVSPDLEEVGGELSSWIESDSLAKEAYKQNLISLGMLQATAFKNTAAAEELIVRYLTEFPTEANEVADLVHVLLSSRHDIGSRFKGAVVATSTAEDELSMMYESYLNHAFEEVLVRLDSVKQSGSFDAKIDAMAKMSYLGALSAGHVQSIAVFQERLRALHIQIVPTSQLFARISAQLRSIEKLVEEEPYIVERSLEVVDAGEFENRTSRIILWPEWIPKGNIGTSIAKEQEREEVVVPSGSSDAERVDSSASDRRYSLVIYVRDPKINLSPVRYQIGKINRSKYPSWKITHRLRSLEAGRRMIIVGDIVGDDRRKMYSEMIRLNLSDIMRMPSEKYGIFVISSEELTNVSTEDDLRAVGAEVLVGSIRSVK